MASLSRAAAPAHCVVRKAENPDRFAFGALRDGLQPAPGHAAMRRAFAPIAARRRHAPRGGAGRGALGPAAKAAIPAVLSTAPRPACRPREIMRPCGLRAKPCYARNRARRASRAKPCPARLARETVPSARGARNRGSTPADAAAFLSALVEVG
ncbi:MAG: hypothetical protein CML67_14135 [Rhodobacteraceae bacterium]|nr:hypothetical protein [Paracoccaceae bacterium]